MPEGIAGPIEVDGERLAAELPSRLLNELAAHARETWPEECCGLLVGDDGERFREILRCANVMTRLHREDPVRYPRDGTEAFHMHEPDYLQVVEQAEARGLSVTGIYHSHVGYGAYLSEMDQEYALQPLFPFPDADHIVLSLVDREQAITAALFERRSAGAGFEGRRLQAEGMNEGAEA